MSELLREDKSGKPDFTYIGEMYPVFARLMARFKEGEVKYSRLNFRECKDNQTYKESFIRHALQYLNGQTDEPHLEAAIINGLILLDLEEQHTVNALGVDNESCPDCSRDLPCRYYHLDDIAKKAGLR